MLNLAVLFWLGFFAAVASFWWQSDLVKNKALKIASNHCRKLSVQLLDQTMVIKGIWPVRNESGSLQLRRRYNSEFSSTGEQRYHGVLTMSGKILQQVELEPHVIP